MTITDITARGGCSRNTWIKVERGQPVVARMYPAIAKGLDVPTELVTDAVRSAKHLPKLLDKLGGAAGPAFPAPSTLDDAQLGDALDALVGELFRRYLTQGDSLRAAMSIITGRTVTGNTPRRPRVRSGALSEPAALAEPAGNRTEQERPHGMG